MTEELIRQLIAAGLTKQQASSVTAETLTQLYMKDDGKILIAEAKRQVQEMKVVLNNLKHDYHELKKEMKKVSDTLLALTEAQDNYGEVTGEKAKNVMYQYKEIQDMSLAAIKKLNDAGIKCSVLTKGILPIELANYSKENEYGITLISTNETFRKRIEPGSAPWKKRLSSLRALHDAGCKTWVSIEPFPTPNIVKQDLTTLLDSVSFVDRIIFGRMNYSKEVTAYEGHKVFFNKKAAEVINFCNAHGIQYHIKEGTIT